MVCRVCWKRVRWKLIISAFNRRMHSNATIETQGNTATLTLNGKTLIATILQPSGATFGTQVNPTRLSSDPALPSGQVDQPNDGVTLLTIDQPAGQTTITVLFK